MCSETEVQRIVRDELREFAKRVRQEIDERTRRIVDLRLYELELATTDEFGNPIAIEHPLAGSCS